MEKRISEIINKYFVFDPQKGLYILELQARSVISRNIIEDEYIDKTEKLKLLNEMIDGIERAIIDRIIEFKNDLNKSLST